jgi:hypothetical protein
MGVADLLLKQIKWTLISQDTGVSLEGKFPPQNLRENVSGVWASQGTLGLSQPILQFVRGDQESVEVDLKAYARHRGILGLGLGAVNTPLGPEDILDEVDQIRNLARINPDLGRPEVWLFSVGEQFSQQVVVQSVGGIRYDRFRPSDGSLRGVMFSVRMLRYIPFDVQDLTGQAQVESLVTPALPGDAYEHIAKRVHGDASLGEALRRRNPDRRTLQPGDLVHVPAKRTLRREVLPLKQQSLPLKSGARQRDNIVNAFVIRGVPALSHIVLEDFGG